MILSASRRTDIPCYYSEWLMNRLRAGYLFTRNPMNPAQIKRIECSPHAVDCIVFWTKDPQPMMKDLDELERMGYPYYFQFTLTPYDNQIERNLRPKSDIESTFIHLSKRVGKQRVVWRYDPIILNESFRIEDHKVQFLRMCDLLGLYTDTVIISFVDLYAKNKKAPIRAIRQEEMAELSVYISETARAHNLVPAACCEGIDLSVYGIQRSACIDQRRIERIIGCPLNIKKDSNQRRECGCCASIDIGAYNTCLNDCVYCYANSSYEAALKRHDHHNPHSDILIGSVLKHETATDKKCVSNRVIQTSLFE